LRSAKLRQAKKVWSDGMRVVHVGNYKPESVNGVDKTIAGLAHHLPGNSVEIEIWTLSERAREVSSRQENGITIVDIPTSRMFRGVCLWSGETVAWMKERAREFDLLHFHSVFMKENIKLARLGLPYVVTPNGGYSAASIAGRNRLAKALWLKLWEREYLKRARMIHAVSQPEKNELDRLCLGVPIRFIPNGVDPALYNRYKAPPPSQGTAFLFLGRLAIEHKGLDLLLRGYAEARKSTDGLPQLILAGPDFRGGRARLEAQAKELGIQASVELAGPVFGEDRQRLVSQAALFVHTSRWEGMPFAVLEAMAVGRPVLVTPGTNLAELVQSTGAGFVVGPDDTSIATGLRNAFAASPDALDVMGHAASRLIARHFAWHTIAAQMSEAYALAVQH
jgi:glycosyltransferase involved in cell wall biosynthesis